MMANRRRGAVTLYSPLSMPLPLAAEVVSKKWHHIPQGRALTEEETNRLADLIMAWIERDLIHHPAQ